MTYPDGEAVTYGESPQGDINSLTAGSNTLATSITSTPWHGINSIALGSGLTTQYGYDFRHRPTSIVTGSVQNLTLGYDDASNVTSVSDSITPTESLAYSYDQLNRLTGMTIGGTTAATYSYNQIGNLTSKVESLAGMSNTTNITSYTYPSSGSARPHAVTSTAGTPALSLTYDASGNLATDGTGTCTYDARNLLSSRPRIGGGIMSYVYGADGALVKSTNSSTGAWTVYIGGVYEVTDTGAVTKYYSVGGKAIAMRQGAGSPMYLLTDQLGSSTTIANNAGAVIATERYWPFGGMRSSTGSTPTDRLFTGQRQEPAGDNALGLYNYNARFYSTTLGRFLSVDPVAGAEGDPQSWNPYTYVRNGPLVYSDPTGMSWDPRDWASSAADVIGGIGSKIHSAYEAVTSTPGAVWDPVTQGLDLGIGTAKACWGNELCQGVAITAGVIGCSAATGAVLACAAGGAVLASLDNVKPCAHGSGSDCAAIAVEAGAAYLSAGGGRSVVNLLKGTTGREIVERTARSEVERLGVSGLQELLSPAERAASDAYPGVRSMNLGKAVERATASRLRATYGLRFPRYARGPDFIDTMTGEYVELTTPGQVMAHGERFARQGYRGVGYATYTVP